MTCGNPKKKKAPLMFVLCLNPGAKVQMNTQIFLNGITLQELAAALIPLLQSLLTAATAAENELMTHEVCEMLSFNKTSL
jgi:hypothetical protein